MGWGAVRGAAFRKGAAASETGTGRGIAGSPGSKTPTSLPGFCWSLPRPSPRPEGGACGQHHRGQPPGAEQGGGAGRPSQGLRGLDSAHPLEPHTDCLVFSSGCGRAARSGKTGRNQIRSSLQQVDAEGHVPQASFLGPGTW